MKKAIKKLIFSTWIILVSLYSVMVEILPLHLYISVASIIIQFILIYATIVWVASLAEIALKLIYNNKSCNKI
jgi:hypothetical protein